MTWQYETVDEELDPIQAAVKPSDWSESFTAGLTQAAVATPLGGKLNAEIQLSQYRREIESAVGKKLDWSNLAGDTADRLISKFDSPVDMAEDFIFGSVPEKFDETIRKIREENPTANFKVKTFNQLRNEIEQSYSAIKAKEVEDVNAANRQGHLGATAAGFVGGMVGFMADPRNAAAVLINPVGKIKTAADVAKFAGIAAAGQTTLEIADLNRRTGLSSEEQLKQSALNIGMAAVAAPLFQGLAQGLSKAWNLAEPTANNVVSKLKEIGYEKAAADIDKVAAKATGPERVAANDLAFDLESLGKAQRLSGKPEAQIRKEYEAASVALQEGKVPSISDEALARYISKNPDDFQGSAYADLEEMEMALSRASQEAVYDSKGNRDYGAEIKSLRQTLDTARYESSRASALLDEDPIVTYNKKEAELKDLEKPGALEAPISKLAALTGDEYKGFTVKDVFGEAPDNSMGAARKYEHLKRTQTFVKEIQDCMIGIL